MTSLAARVLAAIRRRQLAPPGARVVAAVSGGVDSVALVRLLAELSSAGALTLASLAHLDHSLRGAESARDAAFCRDLAAELGIPFDVEAADVMRASKEEGRSLEDAGRQARYGFFDRARARAAADLVATAHTRDDQAETVLLRLFRGAGTRGLAGIPPRRGAIVRPLIDIGRDELREYLDARGYGWVEDSTNVDRAIPRNWVRHELLPLVTERYGPATAEVLARAADLARSDDAALEELAVAAAAGIERVTAQGLDLAVPALLGQPTAVRQRVVRSALARVGGEAPAASVVAGVLQMAEAGRSALSRLGACDVELSPALGVLSIRGVRTVDQPTVGAWSHELPVPGAVDLPEAGGRLLAERTSLQALGGLEAIAGTGPDRAVASGIGPSLVVRAWRPGDALQVLGLSGRKKVQDLFVDRKVPRARRALVPIITDDEDRIVWVAGHALSELFRVTMATKSVVILSFEPFGGP
jgi:tRNA(Ile)-lysidine synthase